MRLIHVHYSHRYEQSGPTIIQMINFTLLAVVMYFNVLSSYIIMFLWCIFIGTLGGTCYTNFIFMANCKTNMKEDFNLSFQERELSVNLLLLSLGIGVFFASCICFFALEYYFPEVLYNPPG